MTHDKCSIEGCPHAPRSFGSGQFARTDFCPAHFADWYNDETRRIDFEKRQVLLELPVPALNRKTGEGTCKWCQEPIYWRQRADSPKSYPAEASPDTDRGHRCDGDKGHRTAPLVGLVLVMLLAAWVPADAQQPPVLCPCTPAPVYGPQTGMDATGRPIHMVPGPGGVR